MEIAFFDEDEHNPDGDLLVVAVFIWVFVIILIIAVTLYMLYNFFFVGSKPPDKKHKFGIEL